MSGRPVPPAPMKRLWHIDGKTYDLTEFLAKHPGGQDALGFGRNLDATALFKSYHLRMGPPAALLAKYEVKDAATRTDIEQVVAKRFTFKEGDFYDTVKLRVRAHFAETGTSMRASAGWQAAALLGMVLSGVALYPAFVLGTVWGAVAHGLVRAMTSIGPAHSMSHFSLFPRGRWNHLILRIFAPVLISNSAIWTTAHVVSHHVDTLTPDDLQDHYPLKRIMPHLPHRAWHRGQHVYAWLIYVCGLPLWSAQDLVLAVQSLFTGLHGTRRFSFAQRVENVLAVAVNLLVTVAMPFFFLPPGRALLVCAISNVISSLILVVQIMVNHEVPDVMGHVKDDERLDWGAHQVLTSHNYAVRSPWMLHFAGGLNLQIEHHLFPGVHYTRFGGITPIVRETCAEFGLPYHESATFREAVGKHYSILLENSRPPVADRAVASSPYGRGCPMRALAVDPVELVAPVEVVAASS